jgi:hypothetical protein
LQQVRNFSSFRIIFLIPFSYQISITRLTLQTLPNHDSMPFKTLHLFWLPEGREPFVFPEVEFLELTVNCDSAVEGWLILPIADLSPALRF